MTQTYNVIDSATGICVSQQNGLRAASRKAESLNQQYGAVRFSYRLAPIGSGRVYSDRAQQRAESGYAQ